MLTPEHLTTLPFLGSLLHILFRAVHVFCNFFVAISMLSLKILYRFMWGLADWLPHFFLNPLFIVWLCIPLIFMTFPHRLFHR